jgi:hypothetical protein
MHPVLTQCSPGLRFDHCEDKPDAKSRISSIFGRGVLPASHNPNPAGLLAGEAFGLSVRHAKLRARLGEPHATRLAERYWSSDKSRKTCVPLCLPRIPKCAKAAFPRRPAGREVRVETVALVVIGIGRGEAPPAEIYPFFSLPVVRPPYVQCAWQESNLRPRAPEARALSPELQAPGLAV